MEGAFREPTSIKYVRDMRYRPTYLEKYYGTILVCRCSVVNK